MLDSSGMPAASTGPAMTIALLIQGSLREPVRPPPALAPLDVGVRFEGLSLIVRPPPTPEVVEESTAKPLRLCARRVPAGCDLATEPGDRGANPLPLPPDAAPLSADVATLTLQP